MRISKENLAKVASIYAGAVFGIYWIPLRALGDAGFSGGWPPVMLNAIPLCIISPFLIYRWRALLGGSWRFHLGGLFAGTAFILYANSFMHTEVIRAILLFYLMPIWGFLLARIFTGDLITPIRWLSMALGLGGLLIIFGVDLGPPVPRNLGDWMALGSGLAWAFASLMMLTDESNPMHYGLAFIFWGTLGAGGLAVSGSIYGVSLFPTIPMVKQVMPWLIPLTLFLIVPGAFATVYGPTQLNPGVVGLFFMVEISVATITAAIFAGEPFGIRELVGVILISSAGLAEPLFDLIQPKTLSKK